MKEYIENLEKIACDIENYHYHTANLPFIIKLQILNLKAYEKNYPHMLIDNFITTLGIMELNNIKSFIKDDYKRLIMKIQNKLLTEL